MGHHCVCVQENVNNGTIGNIRNYTNPRCRSFKNSIYSIRVNKGVYFCVLLCIITIPERVLSPKVANIYSTGAIASFSSRFSHFY